jgi:glycosyltransferase involved in cell wall biosynthesis
MPRILLVHQPTGGGVGRHVSDLATGLAERGCDVTLCGPARPMGELRGAQGVNHIRLDLHRAITLRTDLVALARFAAIVRSVNPDLIHAHSSKAGAIARLGRLMHPRVPVLYTPHGYAFAGHFSRELERHAYRVIERILAPLASRVLCVCEAEGRLARTVGPANRVRVVHNGIEPVGDGPIDPQMAALARRGPVVCALTQLRPGKGLETLIDALPTVLAKHPTVQVAIGGEGPDIDALRSRAHLRGVSDAVHFLGRCEQPLEVLRGSQIFVHPSWAESFPYVILEAMAVGLPIVASDVGGISEALIDGESGTLVPPDQSQALSHALVATLSDLDRRRSMGDAARSRLEGHFTLEAMIEGHAAAYGEVSPACRGLARTRLAT